MDILRKVMLALAAVAFAVCSLFLNLLGGLALIYNNYTDIGICLLVSSALFGASLVLAFFRNAAANIISAIANIAATALYIYPIGVLNAIPHEQVPKESVEILTARIYPSIAVTVFLLLAVAADALSYDRMSKRAAKRLAAEREKNRPLTDSERII